MKNKMALTSFFVGSLLTGIATADVAPNGWVAGIGYSDVSEVDLGVVWGSLGYKFKVRDRFSITPEVRFGKGTGNQPSSLRTRDGDLVDIELKLDTHIAVSLRGDYEFQNGAYLFVSSGYGKSTYSDNLGYISTNCCWRFAFLKHLGAGYNFSEGKKLRSDSRKLD